jgi:hypothetical protein
MQHGVLDKSIVRRHQTHSRTAYELREFNSTLYSSITQYAIGNNQMQNHLAASIVLSLAMSSASFPSIAQGSLKDIEKEGTRDGKRYAEDLRKRGVTPDGTACAVGMAAEDASRPHFNQTQAETYAKAFGNACVGKKVF